MSNASKPFSGRRASVVLAFVLAFLAVGPAAASGQENQVVAVPAPAAAASPEGSVAVSSQPSALPEAVPQAPVGGSDPAPDEPMPLSNEEVLQMLRSGNNGKPLNVAQLAAINDTLKRLEFLAQIESKMRQMSLGAVSPVSSAPAPSDASPVSSRMAAMVPPAGQLNMSVLRVIGSGGHYMATILSDGKQTMVRQGDETEYGRVVEVSLGGVVLAGDQGTVTLPFAAPSAPGMSQRGR